MKRKVRSPYPQGTGMEAMGINDWEVDLNQTLVRTVV